MAHSSGILHSARRPFVRLQTFTAVIQRLITALQALAAPADVQLSRFPELAARAELALDFDDALMLVRDCPQLELTRDQDDALAAVERTLSAMCATSHAQLWTAPALRESAEWRNLRRLAAAALDVVTAPSGSH